MTNQEYYNALCERIEHGDTMRALSPLELEHYSDYSQFRESLNAGEREIFDQLVIDNN